MSALTIILYALALAGSAFIWTYAFVFFRGFYRGWKKSGERKALLARAVTRVDSQNTRTPESSKEIGSYYVAAMRESRKPLNSFARASNDQESNPFAGMSEKEFEYQEKKS
jgi:hypothetical protein